MSLMRSNSIVSTWCVTSAAWLSRLSRISALSAARELVPTFQVMAQPHPLKPRLLPFALGVGCSVEDAIVYACERAGSRLHLMHDGAAILASAAKLALDVGALKDGWTGFGVLHESASRVGALDIGFSATARGLNVAPH